MEYKTPIQQRIEKAMTNERGYDSDYKDLWKGRNILGLDSEVGLQFKLGAMDCRENKISYYEFLGFGVSLDLIGNSLDDIVEDVNELRENIRYILFDRIL